MPIPKLVIVSGISASGKTTLAKALLTDGVDGHRFLRVVTTTDRTPRHKKSCTGTPSTCNFLSGTLPHDPNEERCEIDGIDYYFVTSDEFLERVNRDEFYEYALVYGQLKGVTKTEFDRIKASGAIPLMVLDIQGVRAWKRTLGAQNVFAAFVVPENRDDLRRRILERDPHIDPDELERRIEAADHEMIEAFFTGDVDEVIVNIDGQVEIAIDALKTALRNAMGTPTYDECDRRQRMNR